MDIAIPWAPWQHLLLMRDAYQRGETVGEWVQRVALEWAFTQVLVCL